MRIPTRYLIALAAAAAALAAGAAGAGDKTDASARGLRPGVVLEAAIETRTESVIFPSDTSGRLQVRSCDACVHATIQLDAATEFILGGQHLALADFARYAQRNPGHNLTIHYRLADTVASRVTVLAP